MASFSFRSRENLASCDYQLVKLFEEVVLQYDCTILSGHRTPGEQFDLFKQGRYEVSPGVWEIKDKRQVVTYVDGTKRLSRHNYDPSRAVDVVPYPIDWEDIDRMKDFGEYVLLTAKELDIKIEWGGHWKRLKDYPHFQIQS